MTRSILSVFLLLLGASFTQAQFYYKDFISSKLAADDQLAYKNAKVRTIQLNSFEANGFPSEDFFCEKRISKDYKKSTLYSRIGLTGKQLLENYFNDNGQLIRTYDSSEFSVTQTEFVYNEKGSLIATQSDSRSNDDDFISHVIEVHEYHYDVNGHLTDMIRIKNESDSIIISFTSDDNKMVAIEKDTRTNNLFYYYYDEYGQMTDITHFNEVRNKMVADYVYTYNSDGSISQLTTTEAGADNFVVWKYKYENGLRIAERLFDKDGNLIGKIEYQYK
jgi:hypothetical protein